MKERAHSLTCAKVHTEVGLCTGEYACHHTVSYDCDTWAVTTDSPDTNARCGIQRTVSQWFTQFILLKVAYHNRHEKLATCHVVDGVRSYQAFAPSRLQKLC